MRRAEGRDGELAKKSVTDAQFERLTRNTYKVLLMRGDGRGADLFDG